MPNSRLSPPRQLLRRGRSQTRPLFEVRNEAVWHV
jgi:hypothetical protein